MSAFDQASYQVRFDWGQDGLTRLAPADVIVIVDVLRFSTTVTALVDAGQSFAVDAGFSRNGAPLAVSAGTHAERGAMVILGCLRNPSAVADAILGEQAARGGRVSVAVIAAGERTPEPTELEDAPRFAVEDLLGAGAIIDALTSRGIDHASPEAAVASEGFAALRGAVRHLLGASGSGRELNERGLESDVAFAAQLDASTSVPVLRAGSFVQL